MIGLGSNRLSVCRRGGMRVTQAGRGGMEWLAGGRMPSWASPYSAQAMAALLAQFSLKQWATIRDYGFAHPEIVGYMNAYAPEDAKIAYSLVEGIGTRWLVGDGVAWINPNLIPQYPFVGEFKVFLTELNNNSICATNTGGSTYPARTYSGQWYLDGSVGTGVYPSLRTVYVIKSEWTTSATNFYVDGTLKYTRGKLNLASTTLYLFNRNGGTAIAANGTKVAYMKITSGSRIYNLVPFKRNDKFGLLDVIDGTFYGNANSSGSFSESIETPSS